MSSGAQALKDLLFSIYGKNVRLVEELGLGERLRLDFFLPDYGLGFEYHGRQHREFVEHFHGDAHGFREAKRRDSRKVDICAEKGIALVVVWFDQEMSEIWLRDTIARAVSDLKEYKQLTPKSEPKADPYRAKRLEAARKARREARERRKESEQSAEALGQKEKRLAKAKEYRAEQYQKMKAYKKSLKDKK